MVWNRNKYPYARNRIAAAADSVAEHLEDGIVFSVLAMDERAMRVVLHDWTLAGRECDHWVWDDIRTEHRRDGDWCAAIWAGRSLCALIAMKLGKHHLEVSYLEGDPRPKAPMKGHRAAVAMDIAVRYAELCGVKEVRIRPLNDALVRFYQSVSAFEAFPNERKPVYYRLEI